MIKYKNIDRKDTHQIYVVAACGQLAWGLELGRGKMLYFFYRILMKPGQKRLHVPHVPPHIFFYP